MMTRPPKILHFGCVLLLLLLFEVNLGLSIRSQSQTIDEGFHLVAGYRYLECGDFGINAEHPPLVKMVAAAPLRWGGAPSPAGECGAESTDKFLGYGLASQYLFGGTLDTDALLFRARMAASLFALILAIACYLFARAIFGESAGLVALTLIVFEPNVLTHGALITTDAAVSAFMLAAVGSLYVYYRRPRAWRLLMAGVLTGLTLASKHSGVLIVPIVILLAALELALRRSGDASADASDGGKSQRAAAASPSPQLSRSLGQDLLRRAGALAAIGLIAVFILWSTYGFRSSPRPAGHAMSTPLATFIANAQEQGTHGWVLTAAIPAFSKLHLLPQAYLYGLVDVLNVSDPGQPPFLLGKLYPHGRWFYFPVAFVIKSTVGFLFLLLLALIAMLRRSNDRSRWLRFGYLLLPPAVVMAVAAQSGLNIGYRHVLPMVGFLCVLIGGLAVGLGARHRAWQWVVGALLLAHVASSLRAYPDYLPYSNEFWGGPSETYRHLTDSNVDWGQGLIETKRYLDEHHIEDCWIAYDGTASLSYHGIRCRPLSANQWMPAAEVPLLHTSGTIVVSALTVSGIEWEPGELNPYRAFFGAKPLANIGGAMLVYQGDFDLTQLAAATHIARANEALGAKKPDAALAEAQEAAALSPKSVRARLTLGRALAANARPKEAGREFEQALALAQATGREWYPNEMAAARAELKKLGPR